MSELIAYVNHDGEVLNLKMLNGKCLTVTGMFRYRGHKTINVQKDGITIGSGKIFISSIILKSAGATAYAF